MPGRKSSSTSKPPVDAAGKVSSIASQTGSAVQTSSSGKLGRSTHDTPVLPQMFGRYRIERELGQGAMGIVYLAEDTQLGRKVALKIPRRSALDDPAALERFYREAQTSSQIRHSHICPVYDVGAIDGTHYLTMAYIPGKPISCFLGKGKLPSARAVASLFRRLALALAEAHKQGVVHRDLKPSNVMLDDRNEPIIMDFGLARQFDTEDSSRITQSGAIVGTPAYMSPEQIKSDGSSVGPQCDIYSLGVMLYQFLTGELPFDGPAMMVLAQILTAQPPKPSERRPDVDPKLEAICLTMMAHDPGQRYATMTEVAAALSSFLKSFADGQVGGGSATLNQTPAPGQTGTSQILTSLPLSSASTQHRRRTLFAWSLGISGGLIAIIAVGTVAIWMSRPVLETVEVAAVDYATDSQDASHDEAASDATEVEVASEFKSPTTDASEFDVAPAESAEDSESNSVMPSEEPKVSMDDVSNESQNAPHVSPTPVPVVTPPRPNKPPAKTKVRSPGNKKPTRKGSTNNRSSVVKKSSTPRPASMKNQIQPTTSGGETAKTFAQYEAAIQKAHDELVSRLDKTIKDAQNSTKLSPEEKSDIVADLQVEKGTFTAKRHLPFSMRVRKHAEAYCVAMEKAESTVRDRLKRYGASPQDLEAAQERMRPRVVGVWRCEASGEQFELRLMSNLSLTSDAESRQGSWTFDEGVLNLKFPDSKAPGGSWHYKCKMNTSGRGFTANHDKAPEIKGVVPE